MEIGSGPFGVYLSTMQHAKVRSLIEPLHKQYETLLKQYNLHNIFESIDNRFDVGADIYIPELKNSVDGIILCRNALDHTPNWSFVLSNISSYARSNCYLNIWTDIQHSLLQDEGHYNLTVNKDNFVRLVENLGFEIEFVSVNKPLERSNLFVEILALKK